MSGSELRCPVPVLKVVVVDDHELVRSGICNALGSSPEIRVVGQAEDGLAALDILQREAIDVLLLDLHMPRMDGYACLDAVRQRWPALPVIILTVEEDETVALDVVQRGAAAYVPKFVRPPDLAALVRQVATGAVIIGGNRLAGVLSGPGRSSSAPKPLHGLTDREVEVLDLVSQGKSNSDIATSLFITTKTVKYHLTGIFAKLGVRNRTAAAAFAIEHGLVMPQRRASFSPLGR